MFEHEYSIPKFTASFIDGIGRMVDERKYKNQHSQNLSPLAFYNNLPGAHLGGTTSSLGATRAD